MKPRRPLWTILLAALIPNPIFALESGVNAMQAVDEAETQSLTAWAYAELAGLVTGFRDMLEPILPPAPQVFNQLDAEIAAFIAEGETVQSKLSQIIESISTPDPVQEPEPVITETQIAESAPVDGFFYTPQNGELQIIPTVTFNDKGQFSLDTSNGINLPDLTIDPRGGGEYSSEIPVVQIVLDQVQVLQNQMPAPIQSLGTDIYNTAIGYKTDAES